MDKFSPLLVYLWFLLVRIGFFLYKNVSYPIAGIADSIASKSKIPRMLGQRWLEHTWTTKKWTTEHGPMLTFFSRLFLAQGTGNHIGEEAYALAYVTHDSKNNTMQPFEYTKNSDSKKAFFLVWIHLLTGGVPLQIPKWHLRSYGSRFQGCWWHVWFHSISIRSRSNLLLQWSWVTPHIISHPCVNSHPSFGPCLPHVRNISRTWPRFAILHLDEGLAGRNRKLHQSFGFQTDEFFNWNVLPSTFPKWNWEHISTGMFADVTLGLRSGNVQMLAWQLRRANRDQVVYYNFDRFFSSDNCSLVVCQFSGRYLLFSWQIKVLGILNLLYSKIPIETSATKKPDQTSLPSRKACPKLDLKHVIFGRVLEGMSTIRRPEAQGRKQDAGLA